MNATVPAVHDGAPLPALRGPSALTLAALAVGVSLDDAHAYNEARFSARFAELAALTSWTGSNTAIEDAYAQAHREVYGVEPVKAERWAQDLGAIRDRAEVYDAE